MAGTADNEMHSKIGKKNSQDRPLSNTVEKVLRREMKSSPK